MKKKSLIEINPQVCFGKPIFAGTRIPIYMVMELIASGKSIREILQNYYPSLTKEHITAAFNYVAKLLANEEIIFSKKTFHAISL